MKIAFLIDPLDTFKIYKDSTFAMMREAARRGYLVYIFEQKDIILEHGYVKANFIKIELINNITSKIWYRIKYTVQFLLSKFDAVIVRKDPPFNIEYLYTTYLLELAEKQGACIFNKPTAIRNYNEKLAIAQFSQFIVPTIVTCNAKLLHAFHAKYKDVIFKPLDGMGGFGIFLVNENGINLGSIVQMLTKNGTRTIMAQRFIPEISDGDKRVLLIGGKVIPYVLARIPQGFEIRGNLAVGGHGVAQKISIQDRYIAESIAPILIQNGILLAGLDIIGNYLTEINVTSPTGFQEIMQQSDFNVAAVFIDELELRILR